MCTTILPAAQWAQSEFGCAQLGDRRRTKRLLHIATQLAVHPGGTLPQAFAGWDELKAAYRFCDGCRIPAQIQAPHLERTRETCRQPGEYLIIEDSTHLDYSHHPATEELGAIGDGAGRGFVLHSALAVRVEAWNLRQRPEGMVVGLFHQQCRNPRPIPHREKRGECLSRPRKTQVWAAGFAQAGRPPAGCQWIYVADRESDFYEPMQRCREHGVDFIIRAYHDRRLVGEPGYLLEALAQAPVLGQSVVEMRARGPQAARTALVEIRSVSVHLDGPWRPGGRQPSLPEVTVLEVREVDPPAGAEPLRWVLLSSLPAKTLVQAQRIIGRYAARWWIEEYHKALKTGAGVEESQLEKPHRLEALIAVLAVVAVRLLSTKFLARSRPDGSEAAEAFGPQALAILEKKLGRPQGGWTNRNVLVATARLGGFLARKHDGMPGWQTIWRGWQRLRLMCEGVETLKSTQTGCG